MKIHRVEEPDGKFHYAFETVEDSGTLHYNDKNEVWEADFISGARESYSTRLTFLEENLETVKQGEQPPF